MAREFSLQCSVPLAAQDDVECLVGSTSLLDVEGVMLKIQTWSEKKRRYFHDSYRNILMSVENTSSSTKPYN